MNETKKDTYYAERRAVSREMRRLAARRKMAVFAAVGCLVTAIVLAVVVSSSVDVADAQNEYALAVDDQAEVVFENKENLDAYPVLGTIQDAPDTIQAQAAYSTQDLELLALVIYQEAGGDACSDSTRRMVAEVALNRVDHPIYPDTLEGVLTQHGQYGMLYWTGLVWPDRAQYEVEQNAVNRAYRIAKEVLTSSERLLPGDVLFQAEFPQGKEIVLEQDGLYFCR